MILWFLIVIVVTSGIIVASVSKNLGKQFQMFLSSMSEGQVNVVENFVKDEYEINGWQGDFEARLIILARDNKMSFTLKDESGTVIYEYQYKDRYDKWRRDMPMHMHRDWEEDFEDFWPNSAIRVIRSESGEQIGTLEVRLHSLDESAVAAMDFRKNMTGAFVRAFVMAGVIGIILALILARTFSKPLRDMTFVARKMKSGDLESRVPEKQDTAELMELAQALNHLSDSLEIQQELRSRLASDLSHEIRTPLSVLKSHLEAIRDGIWTLDDNNMDILLRETDRLMNMTEQIRFIEDIEAHELHLYKRDTDMKAWLEDISEYFRPEVEKQDKQLVIDLDEITLAIDQDKFKQIMFNLISNALHHTEAGDTITLRIGRKLPGLVLEVEDTGKGIGKEDISHIFERLYRSEDARSRINGGSGLGLAVVKSLVEAHDFEIEAESEQGKGTIMRIIMVK